MRFLFSIGIEVEIWAPQSYTAFVTLRSDSMYISCAFRLVYLNDAEPEPDGFFQRLLASSSRHLMKSPGWVQSTCHVSRVGDLHPRLDEDAPKTTSAGQVPAHQLASAGWFFLGPAADFDPGDFFGGPELWTPSSTYKRQGSTPVAVNFQ